MPQPGRNPPRHLPTPQAPTDCWHPPPFLAGLTCAGTVLYWSSVPALGLTGLRVRVGERLSICLYQHTPWQWLPGGYSKCKTDVHLSWYHLGRFLCSSTDLAPSYSHWYEEKTFSTAPAIWIHFSPSLQLIMFLSINANKKKKITYFVSFIFTYHVYACLFFAPACYWFPKHLLQHFLHHDLYHWGGAAASCCSVSEPQGSQPSLENFHQLMIKSDSGSIQQETNTGCPSFN